jgi:hypothetical protein
MEQEIIKQKRTITHLKILSKIQENTSMAGQPFQ